MADYLDRLLDLTIQIQQIPAPTFAEGRRAASMRERFAAEGLADVAADPLGNVFARLPGEGSAAPLIVSAHLDTVFPPETDLHVRREADRIIGAGIGDNSIGVAALIGLVWRLRERGVQLPGDLWLAADVGEEGLGDLRGMRAVVERFGAGVQAYLVIEGMALGHIYQRAIGVQRFRIIAKTAGGHAWSDHGQPSAVHELAALVTQLTALPLPCGPRTTLNVGKMAGGMAVNALAAEAALELDLRSESQRTLADLVGRVEQIVRTANKPGVTVTRESIGQRPPGAIPADHPLVRLAEECLRAQGIEPSLISGSTDVNLPLSRGYPALALGVTTGGGAHTVNEFIHTAPVAQGMEQLARFVEGVFSIQ